MLGVFLERWYALALGLALVILLVSLGRTRKRYWLAVAAYNLLALGTAVAVAWPIVFQISLANAFASGRSSSSIVYLVPLLVVLVAAIPAFVLFPVVRSSTARRIAILFFGLPLLAAAIFSAIAVFRPLSRAGQSAPYAGFLCLLFLLLWMRVDGLRRAPRPPDAGN